MVSVYIDGRLVGTDDTVKVVIWLDPNDRSRGTATIVKK